MKSLKEIQNQLKRWFWLLVVAPMAITLHLPGILLGLFLGLIVVLIGRASKNQDMAQYGWNVLITHDQTGNVLFGGDPDETISSRVGKLKGKRWWATAISWVLDKIDPNHTDKAVESDEGSGSIVE